MKFSQQKGRGTVKFSASTLFLFFRGCKILMTQFLIILQDCFL